ncbi:PREDICTED: glutathione S-transferase T2-like [Prunus mume]|uniref:Glutathione S-transferase T2-like n=1 Tax=Prunus mume TaxID=102107 RepID=A0ABM0NBW6_PRUMU|nr:PREDICTED: glutathione S-transferase T2-like [Prunus mume]
MLSQRWQKIQKEVNRFSGCIATINERNQSGKTEQDKIADAKATYEAIYKAKFNLDHAWILLRHQPKWLQTQESVSKKRENQSDFTSFSSSSTERTPIDVDQDNTNDAYAPTKRPLGKKAEKSKMKETTSDEPTPILVQIQTLHEEKKERDERKMELIKKKVEQDEKKTPTQTNGVRDENYVY